VYGPQEMHKGSMASVVLQLYRSYTTGKALELFEGSDRFRRDFVFVEDVVRTNLFFLERRVSGIFNCGTGRARSFADLASAVARDLPNSEIKTVPFPSHLSGKYQEFTEASLTALRAAGYINDFTSLETGVAKYIACLQERGGFLAR
jgi:ADP-L-glycero-D-manno-heptose 6-epimerase